MNILSLPNELLLKIAKNLNSGHLASFIEAAPELYPLLASVLESRFDYPIIIWAAIHGHKALVKILLDTGADVNSEFSAGTTALHYAAMGGDVSMVELLMDHGADTGTQTPGSFGWSEMHGTPLHCAAQHGKIDVVQFLLDRGVDPDQVHTNGSCQTALCVAAANEQYYVVKTLLDNGASQSLSDDEGKVPLHYAVEIFSTELVTLMLRDEDSDVNAQDNHGKTLLHYAVETWSSSPGACIAMTELLLRWGADTEHQDEDGQTPLHIATAGSHQDDLVNLLLKWGANIFVSDKYDRTPIQFAEMNEYRIDITVRSSRSAD